jgi:hypothetical protein
MLSCRLYKWWRPNYGLAPLVRESPHYSQIIHVLQYINMFKSKYYYVLWTVSMCTTSLHSKFCKIVLWYECYPRSKRGNTPTQISSQILKPLFCEFWGSFALYGNGATTAHLPRGLTPTNTCPTKKSQQ